MKIDLRKLLAALLILPLLLGLALPAGALDDADTVYISTVEEFLQFAQDCSFDAWSWGKTVYLKNDIALDGTAFEPIATFGGTFNGNGHTISGVKLESSFAPTGLFRVLQENGEIQNLTVNITAAPTGDVSNTGGIVGENHGKIRNCTVTGSIAGKFNTGGIAGINMETGILENCESNGSVTGKNMTGGIAGSNQGTIISCRNSAFVNNESSDPLLNPSQIDLDFSLDLQNISSLDSMLSTSDSGGIAGYSSGEILSSKNTGVVGYPHFGYNIGGIVGRSCGYVYSCENSGYICGRKDVGGIVGQMEPEVETILSEDYLESLSEQFENLSILVDRAGNHASGAGWSVQSHFQDMRDYLSTAQNAVASLFPTSLDDVLAGPNIAALDTIRYSISGMRESAKDLGSTVGNSAGTLGSDVATITDQISAIADTFALASQDLKENEPVTDTSSENVDAITQGKVSLSTNNASVYGDINVGGIAGSMSLEVGADPEDDLSVDKPGAQLKRYQLKTIIQGCINTGNITSKKSYAGSVCGRMDLGLITNCEGYGQIESEGGNYVGGIAGQTSATVQNCFAKCILLGADYVGGIVGDGLEAAANGTCSSVTGCYAMVDIDRYEQYAGAISGGSAGSFVGNFFVSNALAGIDHTSYAGKAEPLSYGEFMALDTTEEGEEGSMSLPDAFKKLTLRFIADDVVIHTETFDYGASFAAEDFPEVPAKAGCSGRWDQENLTNLQFDTVVTAEYTQYIPALPSFEKREEERPILFVSGEFAPEDAITITVLPITPEKFPQIPKTFWDTLKNCFTGTVLCREISEQWEVQIPDDGLQTHTIRYLPVTEKTQNLHIFVKEDDTWQYTDAEMVGSYLSFETVGNAVEFAAVSTMPVWWVWVLAGVLVMILLLLVMKLMKKQKKPKSPKPELVLDEGYPGPPPKKRRKKRWIIGLLVLSAVVIALVFGIYHFQNSNLKTGLDAYQLISQYADQEKLAIDMTVTAEVGGSSHTLSAHLEKTSADGTAVTVIRREPISLYYINGLVYLENGKAFKFDGSHPDYSQLLKDAAKIFRNTGIEESEGTYTISAQGEDAMGILKTLMPSQLEDSVNIQTFTVTLTTKESVLTGLLFQSEGTLEDDTQTYHVSARMDVAEPDPELTIPKSVLGALGNSADADTILSDDLIALTQAWMDLNGQSLIAADLNLSADCGPLVISEDLDFHQQKLDGLTVGCLQKNNYSIYFTDKRLCDKNGAAMTLDQQPLVESVELLDIAYELCMNSAYIVQNNCYTISLDKGQMESIVHRILPETADMAITFESGSIRVYLSNGAISRITVSCSGSMEIMIAEVGASISANIRLREPDADFSIPEKVISALRR